MLFILEFKLLYVAVMRMKWMFILVSSAFIASCSDVVFDQPQPISKNDLTVLKDSWNGSYYDGDELFARLEREGFYWQDRNKLVPWSSDSVHLRRVSGKYVLSMQSDNGWDVYILERNADRLTLGSFDKPESMNKEGYFEQLKESIAHSQMRGEKLVLQPTKREFRKLIRKEDLLDRVVLERKQ